MAVEHVKGPLRNAPSGPLATLPVPVVLPNENNPFFHIENVTFGQFTFTRYQGPPNPPIDVDESQSTREDFPYGGMLSTPVVVWPLPPPEQPSSLWHVIANPIPLGDGPRPDWMNNFSISHVRIESYTTVFPNPDNPTIPIVGAQAATVVMGVSLLKEIPDPGVGVGAFFTTFVTVDLMFFRRGTSLNRFIFPPA